jgi:hypothetical protein
MTSPGAVGIKSTVWLENAAMATRQYIREASTSTYELLNSLIFTPLPSPQIQINSKPEKK